MWITESFYLENDRRGYQELCSDCEAYGLKIKDYSDGSEMFDITSQFACKTTTCTLLKVRFALAPCIGELLYRVHTNIIYKMS